MSTSTQFLSLAQWLFILKNQLGVNSSGCFASYINGLPVQLIFLRSKASPLITAVEPTQFYFWSPLFNNHKRLSSFLIFRTTPTHDQPFPDHPQPVPCNVSRVQPILRARFRHQAERKPKVNSPKTFYIKVSTRYLNKRSLPNTYPVSGLERTALSTSESAPAFFDQQTDSAPVQKHQINAVCAQLIFLGLFWAPVICSWAFLFVIFLFVIKVTLTPCKIASPVQPGLVFSSCFVPLLWG